jgi:histidine triad (HIT) family protein
MAERRCPFCSILAGETPAVGVLDTPDVLAFLDHRPLFPGHTLVLPRRHVETLRDLDAPTRAVLFAEVQRVAAAVQDAMGAQGSFVAMNNVVSQSVPHLHVHVVPRNRKDGLRGFFWPRTRYADDAEAEAVAAAIRAVLDHVAL